MTELSRDAFGRATRGLGDGSQAVAASERDFSLDFLQIGRLLRQGWWIIGLGGLLGGLLAAVFVLQATPLYRAKAQLLLSQSNRADDTLGNIFEELSLDNEAIAGQIAVMTSGRFLTRVSERLELDAVPAFTDPLDAEAEAPSLITRTMDGAVDLLRLATGTTVSEPEGGAQSGAGAPETALDVAALSERRVLGEQERFVAPLARNLSVRQVGSTDLIDVRYISDDPRIAAAVPNAVADLFIEYQLEQKFDDVQQVTDGLNERLDDLRERVEAAERRVIAYRDRMLSEGFVGEERIEMQLRELSTRHSAAAAVHTELSSELVQVERLIEDRGALAAEGLFESDLIERLRSEISDLYQREDELLSRFGASTPQSDAIERQIARQENRIRAEIVRLRDDLKNRVDVARAREGALLGDLTRLEQRALERSSREVTLAQFQREHDAARAIYEVFLDKFVQSGEVVGLQQSDAQIVHYANVPKSPISPRKKETVVLGGVGGTVLAMGLVFLKALVDRSVNTVDRLQRLLPSTPIVTLPRLRRLVGRARPLTYIEQKPHSALAEAVYSLRSHLSVMRGRNDGKGRVVTVVSAQARAAKTTTSIMLARATARMGQTCVMVDADLRRGAVARDANLRQGAPDLIDVLAGEATLADALQRYGETGAYILPSRTGVQDPSGILLSEDMRALIETLRRDFDLVIIDTAPLLVVSDAIPMVRLSDGTVMIVNARSATEPDVQNLLNALRMAGANVVAAVLSMTDRGSVSYDDGYIYE